MEASRSSAAQRARTRTTADTDPQDSLFDRVIENDILERALVRRKARAEDLSTARSNHKEADDAAKALIADLEVEVGEVIRVGRFRIKRGKIEGGAEVSFTTGARTQLYISEIRD